MPRKGYKQNKEHIEKLRKSRIGKTSYWKGKKMPQSLVEKIRQSRLDSPNRKEYLTDEHREKISKSVKKYFKENPNDIRLKINPFLGKKHTKESIEKMKMSRAKQVMMRGETHHWWRGGHCIPNYSMDWTDDLRESIRKRDNYICQECGIHQDECKRKLDVHHIDYDKENSNPHNLISLCRNCHIKTNYNREYWVDYLRILLT